MGALTAKFGLSNTSLIVIGVVVVLLLFLAAVLLREGPDRYAPKRLLTKNEEEFFKRLVRALPDLYVFPQVAFRAFLKPGASAGKAYGRQLGRIGAKHCDFMICTSVLDVVAIVELDDRTHVKDSRTGVVEKDVARDAMTGSAGYTTIRYESRSKPSVADIRDDIERIKSSRSAYPV